MRSDVQQCHSFRNSPWIITFSRSLASLSRNARYFENRSLIPNIIGAIDGSHIRVAPPKRNEQSYFNRKSFHSVILQAVCDPRGYFMSIGVQVWAFLGAWQIARSCTLPPSTQTQFAILETLAITYTALLHILSDHGL